MVYTCVRELKEPDRTIMEKRYWEELKTREIADQMKMEDSTIKTILRRNRDKLGECLLLKGYEPKT